jgi:hypothetical protein
MYSLTLNIRLDEWLVALLDSQTGNTAVDHPITYKSLTLQSHITNNSKVKVKLGVG